MPSHAVSKGGRKNTPIGWSPQQFLGLLNRYRLLPSGARRAEGCEVPQRGLVRVDTAARCPTRVSESAIERTRVW
jgi:hypothetical protein